MNDKAKDELTMQVIKWKDSACSDSVSWVRDVNGVKDHGILNAYMSGYANGFMEAYHLLLLHGKIEGIRPS
jgi:hypothetical protein